MTDLDKLKAEWDARLAAAEDEEKPELRAGKAEAIAAYWESQSASQERQRHVVEVMQMFPDARPAEITGTTREEIEASAKASDEAIKQLIADRTAAETEAAVEQAGGAAWGGNTASPPAQQAATGDTAEVERIFGGLREGNPEAYTGDIKPNAPGLKRGDIATLDRIRLKPEFEAMEDQQVRRGVQQNPSPPPVQAGGPGK